MAGPGLSVTVDGNEAAASVAHRLSEVIVIYPITPSSPMGELADEWSAAGRQNIWGSVPQVTEMQSEAGAAGALHGAMQAGALTATFTSSQGLLLMIPDMYKIAGELNPFVIHVAARAVATHALSIFGDHSDVMTCRATGFALLAAGSVQEAQDLAAVAHAASLESRVPFLHFFDGFRTSHEVNRIASLSDDDLRALVDEQWVAAHRLRALSPDHPVIRGTSQNPDAWFQGREAANPFYRDCPGIVQRAMDRFARRTGRGYHLFDYSGHPEAERVLVLMGSGAEVAHETVDWLVRHDERVGLVTVRLYRPFDAAAFAAALPCTVKAVAVLDRTKEPGALGEPLYLDVVAALRGGGPEREQERLRGHLPAPRTVIGGRYGLGSKEFAPYMVKAVLDELKLDEPRHGFTVGIDDDVSGTSLPCDPGFDVEPDDVVRAVIFGLGADGTVGANRNTIKIIGEDTPLFAQGYFVYDSKKSGGTTTSHLRFGPRPIRSSYLVRQASFVGCHQFGFLETFDVLGSAAPGAVFLLNAPHPSGEVWDLLPREVQQQILEKELRCHVIDAYEVARQSGLGVRINTIMQTCFFAISGVLPREEAIARIKDTITRSYGKKGEDVVRRNHAAVDRTLAHLHELRPGGLTAQRHRRQPMPAAAPEFVRRVEGAMLVGEGDRLPVSAFPVDGTWPLGTSRWEKRNIGREIPIWDPAICIQCGKCAFVCPHATIRTKLYEEAELGEAGGPPPGFRWAPGRGRERAGLLFTVQVAPEDCTGCRLCVTVCPAKDRKNPRHKAIDMAPQHEHREEEAANWDFFLKLPSPREQSGAEAGTEEGSGRRAAEEVGEGAGEGARRGGGGRGRRAAVAGLDVRGSQLLQPLFEFSGACAGCGETQYIRLLTQLFGDRMLIANATGCTSIYGGNLPTTPYTTNAEGRGPAWSNSLFEDNAEFGLGMRLALDRHAAEARALLAELAREPEQRPELAGLAEALLRAEVQPDDEAALAAQRARVAELRRLLGGWDDPRAARLAVLAEHLVPRQVWCIGGDGWAYDIGYGGLDHVLASGRDVNLLVLDTEVYSNTGGQQSKATPLGATAKFAAAGKEKPKKDLGLMAMAHGSVYVAQVAWGARDGHTVQALREAAAFPGPSLVIAYSHCIAHGYDLAFGAQQQRLAVETGYWPLYRYDPRRREEGLPALQLDSGPPKVGLEDYVYNETRYRMLHQLDPERARHLLALARAEVRRKRELYEELAKLTAL